MRPARAVRYWMPGKQAGALAARLPEPAAAPASAQRRSVPSGKRLTPGGDDNGYAPMARPFTRAAYSRISGRLFFVNASGHGDACSASVVRSAAELLVITAAHCVYSVPEGAGQGRWHSNFAFVPAYDGRATGQREREPYGRWGGRRAWKPAGYTGLSGGDWNSIYDIALIEVGARNGTLQDTVGAFTPMRGRTDGRTIVTIGYPGILGRTPYDGRDQLWCLARTQPVRAVAPAAGAPMPAARAAAAATKLGTYNCHLARGHSGGPWVLNGTRDLVGVLSAGTEDGQADGYSVANTLNPESYGAIVKAADPRGVYDALSIKVEGPDRPVTRGATVTVTATVAMRGLMAASQVPVTFHLPPGARLGAVRGATCAPAGPEATCPIPAVRPGTPVRISARVHVARDAGRSLPISAHVDSTSLDPAQSDNTSTFRLRTRP
jgi:V8-like Glu-specific endopeptidase